MSDNNDALVGISLGDAFRAQELLTAITRLNANGQLKLRDAVVVVKDEAGGTRVRETIDPQPGPSALSGAVWTGLLGLVLGGPVGWLAGAALGAGVGAGAAKVIDVGVPDEWVTWFRDAVRPGTTTLVLLMGDVYVGSLAKELERFPGASLVHATLPESAISLLREATGEVSEPTPTPPLEPPPAVDADPAI